jgi:hypothetical protein
MNFLLQEIRFLCNFLFANIFLRHILVLTSEIDYLRYTILYIIFILIPAYQVYSQCHVERLLLSLSKDGRNMTTIQIKSDLDKLSLTHFFSNVSQPDKHVILTY